MDGTDEQRRFDALWDAHYRAVVAYAARRAPGHERDIAADVFLAAWRRLDRVPADALPWLLAIARHKVANHRRGAVRRLAAMARLAREPEPPGVDPADAPADVSRLREALATLSERDREIIALTAWDGLSPTQAGAVIGVSPQAAAVRLHRARARLAAALERGDAHPADLTPAQEPPR